MKQITLLTVLWGLIFTPLHAKTAPSRQTLLKDMFHLMVEKKDASLIPKYYAKDFLLYSNGKTMDYDTFVNSHEKVYQTNIQYRIRFDESAFVEQDMKLAARVFITTEKKPNPPREIEVILIAEYKGNKIHRVWELTYPDWSKMKSFNSISN